MLVCKLVSQINFNVTDLKFRTKIRCRCLRNVSRYRYRRNIETMSAIVRDELVKPIERAVWSVEHVLKFPNSRHLRYRGRDMSWIDYCATYPCLAVYLIVLPYFIQVMCIKATGAFILLCRRSKWINDLKRKFD